MKKTVLCYNLKGTKKGKEISMIFSYLGFRVRSVDPGDYELPISDLLEGKTAEKAAGGEGFKDEMLVISGAGDDTLNQALYLMNKQKASVDLKAVVTDNNKDWTSLALHQEIAKEHQYMKGNKES